MFDLNTMEVGDVWKDTCGDLINIFKVLDGRYVGWYNNSTGLGAWGSNIQTSIGSMVLVSRGGVEHHGFENGKCYHCRIGSDSKTVIRRYEADGRKMVDFRGNRCNLSTYDWISDKIEMSSDQREQSNKGGKKYV